MGKVTYNAGAFITAAILAAFMIIVAIVLRLAVLGIIVGGIAYFAILFLRSFGAL